MLIRSLVCAVIGTLGGSAGGAFILGWNASMAIGSSWLGPTRNMWPLSAYVGGLGGAAFGLILGLFISLAKVGIRGSANAGSVVGMIGVMTMLFDMSAVDAQLRSPFARVAPLMLSVIIWVLLALLLSVVSSQVSKLQSPPRIS